MVCETLAPVPLPRCLAVSPRRALKRAGPGAVEEEPAAVVSKGKQSGLR